MMRKENIELRWDSIATTSTRNITTVVNNFQADIENRTS